MDVALLQEAAANRLPRSPFEQNVVGNHDRGAPVNLQERSNVLQEVELLVRGRGPEVLSQVAHGFGFGVTLGSDHLVGRLLAEWRIGEHYLEMSRWGRTQ